MKFYKDFKVNEGAFVLKEILEVMYVSESISLPPYIYNIYRKVINLQKALCDYLEGGYPDIDMDDNHLFRRCYYTTNSHPKKIKKPILY